MKKSARELVESYARRGFRLLFYPTKTKGPLGLEGKGWTERTDRPEDYVEGQNVGTFTGHEIAPGRFLADVDFDWAEGGALAKLLFPPTGFGFGRDSKPISHAFYTVAAPLPSVEYKDLDEKKTLVEFRCANLDGSIGHQTMLPPSIHPNGEPIELKGNDDIGHVPDLPRHVLIYAIGCLLIQHLGTREFVHDVRLATAGFLLDAGLTVEETIRLGEALATLTGNDTKDVALTVKTSAVRKEAGERNKSRGSLAKILGERGRDVTRKIIGWLGGADFYESPKGGIVKDNAENITKALKKLGGELWVDDFAKRMMVRWRGYEGPYSDEVRNNIWLTIDKEFNFRPSAEFFDVVMSDLAYANKVNPVRQYLDSLVWDGTPRIDNWLTEYGDAPQNDFTRAVGRIVLVAAVRRIRVPGCKFDEMLVLESVQGKNKSTALLTLCPHESWFSDDLPLNVEAKQIIERTSGKWIIEASDLAGMRKSQAEHLKAMLSRRCDGPVRLAYRRVPEEQDRQFIIIGTTNNEQYLKDSTGNRRFWPVPVRVFDIARLAKDRDQLWAEAAKRESEGESIRLDQTLWSAAERQQDERRSSDPWEDSLDETFSMEQRWRLTNEEIWAVVNVPIERRTPTDGERLYAAMTKLKFRRMSVKDAEGRTVRGWGRDTLVGTGDFAFDPESGGEF